MTGIMFVTYMAIDERDGSREIGATVENPTWEQIEGSILRLDGQRMTQIVLGALEDDAFNEDHNMAIGGGGGVYTADVVLDGGASYVPVDLSKGTDDVTLIVGGQVAYRPARHCLDIQTVLQCAETFVRSGELDSTIQWEQM